MRRIFAVLLLAFAMTVGISSNASATTTDTQTAFRAWYGTDVNVSITHVVNKNFDITNGTLVATAYGGSWITTWQYTYKQPAGGGAPTLSVTVTVEQPYYSLYGTRTASVDPDVPLPFGIGGDGLPYWLNATQSAAALQIRTFQLDILAVDGANSALWIAG